MSECVVIEVSDRETWAARHGAGREIPPLRRPSVLQASREVAEAEAKRLAAAHPDRVFVVFEAVAAGITIKLPTHVTVGGEVVASRSVAAIAEIGRDDDIPF